MRIRVKIVLIVLPLIVAPFILIGIAASLAARNGITGVATDFLQFKAQQLQGYAQTQWGLLEENELSGQPEFVRVAQSAVASFARSLIRSDTELIVAVGQDGEVAMQTGEVQLSGAERDALADLARRGAVGWRQLRLGGAERVGQAFTFAPFGWYVLVTEQRRVFYQAVNQIFLQSAAIIVVAAAVSVFLLLLFSGYLTTPLASVVAAMREVIANGDLSRRVALLYNDETGELGHTFNLMTKELEKAYNQVKGFAYQAAIARKREQKIRSIFQRYVPAEVIEQFFANPETMLVGDNRVLAVLFSDIRNFTTLAENLPPESIVESLNRYFSVMVDVIMARKGIVDKYIGDAIMAFYGAPVHHEDDAQQAVRSGLEMIESLEEFNRWQAERGRPRFTIGVGINYGAVTVGNIGSEKKMDYTVIGDMVNLASRLEGLTKIYGEPLIVSEAVRREIGEEFPCRQIDKVAVKGRTHGVKVYAVQRELSREEQKGWKLHHTGLEHYYRREFEKAARYFLYVQEVLPRDGLAPVYLRRCQQLLKHAPGEEWEGIEVMLEK